MCVNYLNNGVIKWRIRLQIVFQDARPAAGLNIGMVKARTVMHDCFASWGRRCILVLESRGCFLKRGFMQIIRYHALLTAPLLTERLMSITEKEKC